MKTAEIILILGLLILFSACSPSNSYNNSFKDPAALRKSRLVIEGVVPRDFVAVIPSTAKKIKVYHNLSDTITYMHMQLSRLPTDFYGLITKMEHSKIKEVTALKPLQPDVDWWDKERFQQCMDEDLFVFRKLPVEDPASTVYAVSAKTGEVYAWVVR